MDMLLVSLIVHRFFNHTSVEVYTERLLVLGRITSKGITDKNHCGAGMKLRILFLTNLTAVVCELFFDV